MAELEVAGPSPPLTVAENGRHERVDAVPQTASTWRVPDRGAAHHERPSVALPSHPLAGADDVPGFLQCEDTYPNPQETAAWWRSFLTDLRAWWATDTPARGQQSEVAATLGTPTPVKRWLVRLLVRKLELCEEEELAKLVRG